MNILHESQPRAHSAHFVLVNGTLSQVADGEYRRWVNAHTAGALMSNLAGIGDRSEVDLRADIASEAHA